MTAAAIRAADLELVLAAARLRRFNGGRTCQLCALTACPVITLECHDRARARPSYRETARRHGMSPARVTPMQRERGRLEVLRTWGSGIRALQAEPAHVLNGGRP